MLKRLLWIAVLLSLAACDVDVEGNTASLPSEDSNPVVSLQESEELIAALIGEGSRIWQISSRRENGETVPLGCHLDDQVIFENHLITFDVGDLLCTQPNGSQSQFERSVTGRWQLTDRRSILVILPDDPPYELKITEITEKHLTLEYRGDSYTDISESYFLVEGAATTEASPSPAASDFSAAPIILD